MQTVGFFLLWIEMFEDVTYQGSNREHSHGGG